MKNSLIIIILLLVTLISCKKTRTCNCNVATITTTTTTPDNLPSTTRTDEDSYTNKQTVEKATKKDMRVAHGCNSRKIRSTITHSAQVQVGSGSTPGKIETVYDYDITCELE